MTPAPGAQVYGAVNPAVLAAIPLTAQRVLDVGCGSGALGRVVKTRQQAEVVGLTYSTAESEIASAHLDRVVVCDLNEFDPGGLGNFDCVVCSHVLEHLYWPERFLAIVRPVLRPGSRLIVALPNLLVWRQRLELMFGRFRYADGGIMDRTHFRFYDWQTARDLVVTSGYRIITEAADGGFPLARFLPGIGSILSRTVLWANPGLFGWQFVIVAEPVFH